MLSPTYARLGFSRKYKTVIFFFYPETVLQKIKFIEHAECLNAFRYGHVLCLYDLLSVSKSRLIDRALQ